MLYGSSLGEPVVVTPTPISLSLSLSLSFFLYPIAYMRIDEKSQEMSKYSHTT